jgi:hypothetical protein
MNRIDPGLAKAMAVAMDAAADEISRGRTNNGPDATAIIAAKRIAAGLHRAAERAGQPEMIGHGTDG